MKPNRIATGLSFHFVRRIVVESHTGGSHWIDITLIGEDGSAQEITVHCPRGTEIEGGEFVNFVAAHQGEAA